MIRNNLNKKQDPGIELFFKKLQTLDAKMRFFSLCVHNVPPKASDCASEDPKASKMQPRRLRTRARPERALASRNDTKS